ncbi:MAG: hypothetical protein MZV64_42945 [Ignavibacteriales bacterium]|nr:hypothetical protein [Ignavibacteriales bacterium]
MAGQRRRLNWPISVASPWTPPAACPSPTTATQSSEGHGRHGNHQHPSAGTGEGGSRRRWNPGDSRAVGRADGRHDRRGWKSLHRRGVPGSQGGSRDGRHHNRGRQRRLRIHRRWRSRHCGRSMRRVPLAMDGVGNLFIGTQNVVRKVDATAQFISTVAGTGDTQGFAGDGGPATQALLSWASGVAVDAIGNLSPSWTRALPGAASGRDNGRHHDRGGLGQRPAGDGGPASLGSLTSPARSGVGLCRQPGNQRARASASSIPTSLRPWPPTRTVESVLVGDTAIFAGAVTGVPAPGYGLAILVERRSLLYRPGRSGAVYRRGHSDADDHRRAVQPRRASVSVARHERLGRVVQPGPASLTVTKRMPTVTWPTPAPILPGTALDATQLNAAADVAGTFSTTRQRGRCWRPARTTCWKATFTPDDSAAYSSAVNYVLLDVIGATGEGARYIATVVGSGVWGDAPATAGPATLASAAVHLRPCGLTRPATCTFRTQATTASAGSTARRRSSRRSRALA